MDKREANRKIAWMSKCARRMVARDGTFGIYDSEDIAQNVMIGLLRHPKFLELGSGWIARVARNKAADTVRVLKKERKIELVPRTVPAELQVAESSESENYCTASTSQTLDLRMDLQKALAGLQKPLMITLWLYSQGYSCLEIAAITKTNRSTVRTRLFYGRKAAQKLLAEAGLV